MSNLLRRLKTLESCRVDITGLAPYSEAWFTSWEEKLDKLMAGEDIGGARMPLEVVDRVIDRADRESLERTSTAGGTR